MRRALSLAMLLLVLLPLVAPALGQPAQQHLMLCCLKGGSHHCAGGMTPDDGAPSLRAHCTACPSHAVAGHTDTVSVGQSAHNDVSISVQPLRIRQVEAGYRISVSRCHHKRGPPSIVLS